MNNVPSSDFENRSDIAEALSRAGDDDLLRAAAMACESGLAPDEFVLEIAATKAHGFAGAAFVTNRRMILQNKPLNESGNTSFEFFDFDSLSNVRVHQADDSWGLICEAFSAWSAWGGFSERGAKRLEFAAQWALSNGREMRVNADRENTSLEIFHRWESAHEQIEQLKLNEGTDGEREEKLKQANSLLLNVAENSRWWIR